MNARVSRFANIDWTGWCMAALLVAVLLTIVVFHGGCASQMEPFRDAATRVPGPHSGRNAIETLGIQLGWYSIACCIIGLVAYIGSYVPVASDFIPRKAALVAFGVGLALAFVRAIVETLGPAGVWIGTILAVISGGLALWPYIHGLWNYAHGTKCVGCPAAVDGKPPVVVAAPSAEVKP